MLKAFLLSAILCALAISSSFARILRVNSNPGVNANFTNVQAAHDGANPEDTLYLEGSTTDYGYLDCTKKLTIIGPGYYLTENPNLQELTLTAKVMVVNFKTGSAGTIFMGMEIWGDMNIGDENIVVKRNKFVRPFSTNPEGYINSVTVGFRTGIAGSPYVNTATIIQNYGLRISVPGTSSNVTISNNYFTSSATTSPCLTIGQDAVVLVQNNIFNKGNVAISTKTTFINNIMIDGSFTGGSTMVSYNIGNGTQFGTANGNKSGINKSDIFIGLMNNTYSDTQWKLSANSPAHGAGQGSVQSPVDDGLYGGETPYIVSGLAPIPAIYFLDNTPVGSNVNPIVVTVKVRSNN